MTLPSMPDGVKTSRCDMESREEESMSTVSVHTREATQSSRWLIWVGWIVSMIPVLIVLMSSRWKLTASPFYVREWVRLGWKAPDLPFIASLQLGAILLYLIPRTSVLGVVILT